MSRVLSLVLRHTANPRRMEEKRIFSSGDLSPSSPREFVSVLLAEEPIQMASTHSLSFTPRTEFCFVRTTVSCSEVLTLEILGAFFLSPHTLLLRNARHRTVPECILLHKLHQTCSMSLSPRQCQGSQRLSRSPATRKSSCSWVRLPRATRVRHARARSCRTQWLRR